MELHDNIGQILTSLKIEIEMIHEKWRPEDRELEASIKAAQERTSQAIKDIKNISRGLRPSMIDALGLESSLRELFNEVRKHLNAEIRFFSRYVPKRFNHEKELALYRIAQEALNNTIKHAKAKNVFINLIKKDNRISMSVEDDGIGFELEKVVKISSEKMPLGLIIMRERATQLDGEFTIESHVGKGTHILVEIPI
jgi:signal transduction histidine kinase